MRWASRRLQGEVRERPRSDVVLLLRSDFRRTLTTDGKAIGQNDETECPREAGQSRSGCSCAHVRRETADVDGADEEMEWIKMLRSTRRSDAGRERH